MAVRVFVPTLPEPEYVLEGTEAEASPLYLIRGLESWGYWLPQGA